MKKYINMNENKVDELIRKAMLDEQELPEGLSERLEQYIDSLAEDEKKAKKRKLTIRHSLYWISGVAAAMLIGIAIFFQTPATNQPKMTDTFSDPQEAAIVAQEALAFMSKQLNKGLDPVADAGREMEKVNKLLTKQFND